MADEVQITAADKITPRSQFETQLEYPQLIVEASLESLLSHSSQPPRLATTPMPQSDLSLSESWSSLSEHDLSHDDDLHSEVTDAGSLIDFSTAGDVHTVDDNGEPSDAEDEENESLYEQEDGLNQGAEDQPRQRWVSGSAEHQSNEQGIQPTYTAGFLSESIRLDESTVVVDENGSTWLHASKSFTDTEMRSSSTQEHFDADTEAMVGTIWMPMSPDNLNLAQRPFNILYHESTFSSSEIKSEVLGKIGAALLSSGDHHKYGQKSESPCYHVIPSEFGPGSRPATADLIPIPTQMYISDATVLGSASRNLPDLDVHLQLSTGKYVISRPAKLFEIQNSQHWTTPDLIVIVVSQHDSDQNRMKSEKMVEFASRHSIAVICLQQEASWYGDNFSVAASQHMLHKSVQSASLSEDSDTASRMLLDVDSFLALDAEQLNQHLSYITATAMLCRKPRPTLGNYLTTQMQEIGQRLKAYLPTRFANTTTLYHPLSSHFTNWVIETRALEDFDFASQHKEKHKPILLCNLKNRAFITTAILRVAGVLALAALTMFATHLCRPIVANLSSSKSSALAIPPVNTVTSGTSIVVANTASTMATPVASPTFALSGPFDALEQQVQSWMPVNRAGGKRKDSIQARSSASQIADDDILLDCHTIVSAHISPNLKVDSTFFTAGEPNFDVQVQRGGDKVTAKVVKQSDGFADILIRRKDSYGKLTILLDGADKQICASIDLENSVGEALTLWIRSLHGQSNQLKTAKRYAGEYTRLLEVRASKSGLVRNALEVHYSAAQGIGAAVEAVEKSAIKHAKLCHNGKKQCFINRFDLTKEISQSLLQARQASEEMIRNTREQISETSRQAKHCASEATEQTREEVTKALQAVQATIGDLPRFRDMWPGKLSKTVAKAQRRAEQLVHKSQSRRRKIRELNGEL